MGSRKNRRRKSLRQKVVGASSPQIVASPRPQDDAQNTIAKYKELYDFATDVLLKEHERFNRADEKASKFATMFVFIIGAAGYFDRWVFSGLTWPDFPNGLPSHIPLIIVAVLVMVISSIGLFLVHHAISVRPVYARPLSHKVLDFFEEKSLVTVYYAWAKRYSAAYEDNKKATDKKYSILTWAYRLMFLSFALLAELTIMYCLYSWI
jgi:hypothetical protein